MEVPAVNRKTFWIGFVLTSLLTVRAHADAEWRTFKSPEFGFEIAYPSDWKVMVMDEKATGSYSVMFRSPNRPHGLVSVHVDPIYGSLQQSVDTLIGMNKTPGALKSEPTQVAGIAAFEVSGAIPTTDNPNAQEDEFVMQHQGHQFEIVAYGISTNWDQYKDRFHHSIDSFKLTGN